MTSSTDLKGLLDRVSSASKPDRYADCHLWVLAQGGDARMVVCDSSTQDFVWERGVDGMWIRNVVRFRAVPKYTASVDAALGLVDRLLPGWCCKLVHEEKRWTFVVRNAPRLADVAPASVAGREDAPLAILSALLTALTATLAEVS